MEFPDLGQNCSEPTCKQLDFLPMKCDACKKIFCSGHFSYEQHKCTESYKKDNQVPVCPLCNTPIPVKRGEPPDIQVSAHIDNECQSDPAKEKRKKIYTNRCSAKGCKTKELIPFTCEKCRSNYCIRHRLETDHDCPGFQGSGRGMSSSGAAAIFRNQAASTGPSARPAARPQQTTMSSIGQELERERRQRAQQQPSHPAPRNLRAMQANMSEDEALAQAMALSLSENGPQPQPTSQQGTQSQQEAEDLALARAIAESERMAQRDRQGGTSQRQNKDKSCSVS